MGDRSKKFRHVIEYGCVRLLYGFFGLLPYPLASDIGGALGRVAGKLLKRASATADENLKRAFPDKTEAERLRVIKGMWDNLGRVFAEYPHLKKMPDYEGVITFDNDALIQSCLAENRPIILLTGHLANWEAIGVAMRIKGISGEVFNRRPNNPMIADFLGSVREEATGFHLISKSRQGAVRAAKSLKAGKNIAFLVDQKFNEGEAIAFFGHEAMSVTYPMALAIKNNSLILPGRMIRKGRCNFTFATDKILAVTDGQEHTKTPADLMVEMHGLLEKWITEHPEQWLWIHKRWDSKRLKGKEGEEQ